MPTAPTTAAVRHPRLTTRLCSKGAWIAIPNWKTTFISADANPLRRTNHCCRHALGNVSNAPRERDLAHVGKEGGEIEHV